jgi:hypothetical protein
LQEAFGLICSTDEAFVLLIRNHYDALFALTGDELGPFRASSPKEFAEASFGGLDLPSGCRELERAGRGNLGVFGAFLSRFGQDLSFGR